jgi:hydroxymethylpyrimidine/phosphomethylpyrimidine kinase
MLAGPEVVAAVAGAVSSCGLRNLVVDPVLVSSTGTRLMSGEAVDVLLALLFPLSLVVTPNLPEAEVLLGREVSDLAQMREAARALQQRGPAWALVTGGHLEGPPVDVLFDGQTFYELEGERIEGPTLHGTGCVLSAAITAHLARGEAVPDAVALAKEHVTGAIRHGLEVGRGLRCVDPAWNLQIQGGRSVRR